MVPIADNITLDAGTGGAVVATDDDGVAHHQYVKLEAGADGTQTKILAGGGVESGALRVTVASDSTGVLSVDDNGGSLTVDGTVAVSGTVTVDLGVNNDVTVTSGSITADTELPTAAALADNAANPTSPAVGSFGMVFDGVTWDRAPGTSADGALVNLGANNDVTVAGVSTAANQTTIIGHVDGIEALLTTIDADTSNLSVVGPGVEATAQRVTIASDSTGVLSVDDNGGSLTVDGTVTANAGTGTMAVSNAGTFAVQDSQVVADNAGFTDGTTKVFVTGYIYDEVAGTALTENDAAAARINVNRAQVGIVEDGVTRGRYATVSAANALKVDGSAVTQPVSGTVTATPSGAAAVVGSGTEATAQRVTIATDSTGVLSVDDNGGSLTVDGTVAVSGTVTVDSELPTAAALADNTANPTVPAVGGFSMVYDGATWDRAPGTSADGALVNLGANNDVTITSGTVTTVSTVTSVTAIANALPAGTNAIGKLAANSGVDIGDVDVTSIAAGTNAIGNVGLIPRTSGGYTIFRSIDLDETEEEIKATAGQLFGWYIFNAAATTHYVKFYNATAANVTVGTTTPVLTIPVPAGSAANVEFSVGIAFGTAITAAATTGIADADTGAPAANAVTLNAFYA